MLFNIFTDGLEDGAEYTLSNFVDDGKTEVPNTLECCAVLWTDLNRFEKWSDSNLMKCKNRKFLVLPLGANNPMLQYRLRTDQLKSIAAEMDLGVLVDSNMTMN